MKRELFCLVASLVLLGCEREPSATQPSAAGAATTMRFSDVIANSGISFTHHFLDSENGSTYRINPYDHGSGVAIADVDGDGLEDIYFCDFLGPNALYRNLGDMRFEDITARAGLAVERSLSVGAAFGDFDGDGDPDLYVTSYRGGNRLFANRGDGTFEDVTDKAGVGYKGHSNTATWFDCDNDGDLDLYVCNIGGFTKDTVSEEAAYAFVGISLPFQEVALTPDNRNVGEADLLFINRGDGTFVDEASARGVDSSEWNGDIAVSDIDLDGDLDFYVSNMFGTNHLFENTGAGHFREITAQSLGRTSWGGMGARFFDADNDPWPDLYVVDMHSDMWTKADRMDQVRANEKFNTPLGSSVGGGKVIAASDETQAKTVLFGNTFFNGGPKLQFKERSRETGLETWWPWGIATGDFDNDGREDVFLSAGMGFPYPYWPNQLMQNQGGHFVDVARSAGIEPPKAGENIAGKQIRGQAMTRSSRSAAIADLDRDGDLDLVVANFNCAPYLLRNDSPARPALRLQLVERNGRPSFGARVQVSANGKTMQREVLNAGGYLGQSSAILHFGLGAPTEDLKVEIFYPGAAEAVLLDKPKLGEVTRVVHG
jgi:hypothetical protein